MGEGNHRPSESPSQRCAADRYLSELVGKTKTRTKEEWACDLTFKTTFHSKRLSYSSKGCVREGLARNLSSSLFVVLRAASNLSPSAQSRR